MNREKDLKRYLKEVKNHLPCSFKEKKRFMQVLTPDIKEFLHQNPDAVFRDIKDAFGEPENICASYLQVMDDDIIKRKISTAKYLKLIITLLIIIIIFFLTILFVDRCINKPAEVVERVNITESIKNEITGG